MKYLQIIIAILIIGCSSESKTTKSAELEKAIKKENPVPKNKYDFVPDSIGFDSPEEVAIQVINFLKKKDTTAYLETAIPLDAQKYLFSQNFEFMPGIKNQEEFMGRLESRFEKRMNNFLVRAKYIAKIMEEDSKFQIQNATMDTITYENVRIKNYGGFDRFIVGEWADLTVKMNYNDEEYFFEIPQIIKVKNKWFLYYPEYYIRTKKELEFIERRVKEINQKADNFWL